MTLHFYESRFSLRLEQVGSLSEPLRSEYQYKVPDVILLAKTLQQWKLLDTYTLLTAIH